ncbi:GH32 C-terminal domain-containing protein [Salipaludibacillus agaradhaerens]|uniref:GH32 C-terminal domain-containing protein n=1 Tax=Salipaludibacillus agaradhaerens TaxID=76935 RepID=UPI002150C334|nr:GH32 C-terminal domain-containing protein [Salipaludibacillus agaradhaerens]MCR6119532.1 GH32 C-terminal domain-containing protein [Salipaludibacillus agaradhaerens]UJW58556.1 GH32 C-terminal domain-containing protein [Bacillus sp. A116_S68]
MRGVTGSIDHALLAHWPFNEREDHVIRDKVQHIEDAVHHVFHQAMFQPNRTIKRRQGISGHALWFDGYSTYVKREKEAFPPLKEGLTISVWLAPHSYGSIDEDVMAALVNQHVPKDKTGFILGFKSHGVVAFHVGLAKGWLKVSSREVTVPKNKWTHVAATYDSTDGFMALYLNGIQVAKTYGEEGVPIAFADADLLIGKHNDPKMVDDTFSLGMFSGLIDDVRIYSRELTQEELLMELRSYLSIHHGLIPEISEKDMAIQREDFASDVHRPQYHLSPPGHWMNEPHAPLYYKGRYHLFYQHNPQGPYWGNIHWGHWISEDLIHWRDMSVALSPEKDHVDPDGTWSGCAHYDEEGVPVLFFTAGDNRCLPNQRIGLARSTVKQDGDIELKKWIKHSEPVLIQPEGFDLDDDGFRDPFVWKEGAIWYQLVGSGINGRGGTALLFESDDLYKWTFKGPLYVTDPAKYPFLGRVWELPILLPLGMDNSGKEKHIFIISPIGDEADVEVFYWIGTWDRENGRFLPEEEEPQLFDLGDFHFTGPSAMIDPKTGRLILFTIAQGERSIEYEYASGWAHNGGLPVELYLAGDARLKFRPIIEVETLRKKKLLDVSQKTVADVNQALKEISGDMLEIQVTFQAREGGCCGLYVRQSDDRKEETLLYYDFSTQVFSADRSKTTLDQHEKTTGVQGGATRIAKNEPLRLRVFLDKSLIEAYMNDVNSLTTRVYPTLASAKGLSLFGDKALVVESMAVWELNGIYA